MFLAYIYRVKFALAVYNGCNREETIRVGLFWAHSESVMWNYKCVF